MNSHQRRKQLRKERTEDKMVATLLSEFPGTSEGDIRYFLNAPNPYISGKLPKNEGFSRIESLFERYLHAADVF